MYQVLKHAIPILWMFPIFTIAAEPVKLDKSTYNPDLGVMIVQVNWGRMWKCGQYENAQLQALSFTQSPADSSNPITLDLKAPSRLFVDNKFLPYAFVVQPGEYVLTAFDVKVARSTRDVFHISPTKSSLIKDGKPVGGTFNINPGEVVYIGHFGLDCGAEPFLWRYYIESRDDFENYVNGFREEYSFVKHVPVQYRLFSTKLLGNPFGLEDNAVK